jgi:hypothetical protein
MIDQYSTMSTRNAGRTIANQPSRQRQRRSAPGDDGCDQTVKRGTTIAHGSSGSAGLAWAVLASVPAQSAEWRRRGRM